MRASEVAGVALTVDLVLWFCDSTCWRDMMWRTHKVHNQRFLAQSWAMMREMLLQTSRWRCYSLLPRPLSGRTLFPLWLRALCAFGSSCGAAHIFIIAQQETHAANQTGILCFPPPQRTRLMFWPPVSHFLNLIRCDLTWTNSSPSEMWHRKAGWLWLRSTKR